MADEITEMKFGSREGSSRGANGVNNPRTFLVKLDMDLPGRSYAENVYPDARGIVELKKVRYGTGHPWDPLAKATQYDLGERIGNRSWKVTVRYRTGGIPAPTMEAAWDRWTTSIRGAAGTEQIIEEPTEALESWGIARPGKLIGTPRFDKGEPAEPDPGGKTYSATVWYIDAASKVASKSQALTRTDSRKVRPYTADVRAMTYTQTRLFANFNYARVGLIVDYYKQVNRFDYLGALPGHLKFVDFNLDEVAHQIGDGSIQLEPGIAYRVSVVFLFSAKAFTPLNLVSTITDDLGNQQPVFDNDDKKVVDENWTIAGMNFETLLTLVSGGRVPDRGGGKIRSR